MKKIMISVILIVLSGTVFSQSASPVKPLTREDYLVKSKSKKTGAWMLLGGGTTVLAITAISAASNVTLGGPKRSSSVVPVSLGAAMMAGSVPLFIAAGKNKRKGMAITFRNVPALQIKNSSMVYRTIPAVSLKINL